MNQNDMNTMGLIHQKKLNLFSGIYRGVKILIIHDTFIFNFQKDVLDDENAFDLSEQLAKYLDYNTTAKNEDQYAIEIYDNELNVSFLCTEYFNTEDNLKLFIDNILDFFDCHSIVQVCALCDNEKSSLSMTSNPYHVLVKGKNTHVACEKCCEESKINKGNYKKGLIGGLLGGFVGMLIMMIINATGLVSYVSGIALILLTFKGFQKFSGGNPIKGFIVSLLIATPLIYLGTYLFTVIEIVIELRTYYIISIFESIEASITILSQDLDTRSYFNEFLKQQYFYCIGGIVIALFEVEKIISSQKITVL